MGIFQTRVSGGNQNLTKSGKIVFDRHESNSKHLRGYFVSVHVRYGVFGLGVEETFIRRENKPIVKSD